MIILYFPSVCSFYQSRMFALPVATPEKTIAQGRRFVQYWIRFKTQNL